MLPPALHYQAQAQQHSASKQWHRHAVNAHRTRRSSSQLDSLLLFFFLLTVLSRLLPLPRRLPNSYDPLCWEFLQQLFQVQVQTARLQGAVQVQVLNHWRPTAKRFPGRLALGALPFGSQAFQLSSLLAYPPCCGCKRGIRPFTGATKRKNWKIGKFPCAGTLYC